MNKPYVVVVTGSRPPKNVHGRYEDCPKEQVTTTYSKLTFLNRREGIARLYEGHSKGTDLIAYGWAKANLLDDQIATFRAQWDKYGPSAGPRRNEAMLDNAIQYANLHDLPIVVLAVTNKPLEESRGTSHMVRYATSKGVPVHHVDVSDVPNEEALTEDEQAILDHEAEAEHTCTYRETPEGFACAECLYF